MFLRSIREHICLAIYARVSACCEKLLPPANDANEPDYVVNVRRNAQDLIRAIEASEAAGNLRAITLLDKAKEAVDRELNEALEKWHAEEEKRLIGGAVNKTDLPRKRPIALFATRARLNLAFTKCYMKLSANEDR
ncbi:hypothetical protein [Janthinobacterium psychrotolerans]|uniref:hypothetical protein n=1 Tax=Janthinobacterium psychrotolerans TaxID=1747903 RepID=UPI001237395E|nr:hypothetical protein [Janthinobacterium psychrotolerans]